MYYLYYYTFIYIIYALYSFFLSLCSSFSVLFLHFCHFVQFFSCVAQAGHPFPPSLRGPRHRGGGLRAGAVDACPQPPSGRPAAVAHQGGVRAGQAPVK